MDTLKVFVSSTMVELRDVRDIVDKALSDKGIRGWVYEKEAGASPESVEHTSLLEVESSDIYVGLFWKEYGEVTINEYRHARDLHKPCLAYIRDKDIERDPLLEEFFRSDVYDLHEGVSYAYFNSAVEVGERIADDIMHWLVRNYREKTAQIHRAPVSGEEIARLQREVNRLQSVSQKGLPQGSVSDYLAQQMRGWFDALDYRFEPHEVRTDSFFEWIIKVPARRGYDRVLIQGIEGEGQISDVKTVRNAVYTHKTLEGWLVAHSRISPAAHTEAQRHSNLFCFTFDELLEMDADFSGYFAWLDQEIKRRRIDKTYVDLACVKDEIDPKTKEKQGESHYDGRNGWIDRYINRWLADPSKEHLSVLGEFGTGKTWFTLHYAWQLMQRYRTEKAKAGPRPRMPMLIPLREYAKALDIKFLISDFFFRKHEVPLRSYSVFEQLNRMGRLLIIFDGFDEMAARVDRQLMIDNFWELTKVVVPGAKAILTCRTEHFPEAKEGRALLSAELRASTAKLTVEPPRFETLYLEKLDDNQIREAISRQADSSVVERVMKEPQLLDLARRPIMIEFLLEALEDINKGKPADISRIYLYAVRQKMERDIKEGRTFTSLADKLYFLCELSWEMFSSETPCLNYRLIPNRIRRLFGPEVMEKKNLDYWHNEMIGRTLLIRNGEGDYTLAHRSLMEFFVAYKLTAELGLLDDDFADLARQQSHVNRSETSHNPTWCAYFLRDLDAKGDIIPIKPLDIFSAEPIEQLSLSFGRARLSEGIIELLMPMLRKDADTQVQLRELIETTRDKQTKEMNYVGGNAATLLVRINQTALKDRDLSGVILSRANLMGADLENSLLCDVDLMSANLANSNLKGANFANSNLSGADMRGANLVGANLERADLSGAFLTEANLKGASLKDANVAGTYLTREGISTTKSTDGVNLEEALLMGPY
jgi:uncharacterized protein YjbI with pentapeptide repeats